MSAYTSRAELACKIDYEGGIHDFVLGYGVTPEDLPDEETRAALRRVLEAAEPYLAAVDAFEDLLPDEWDEDEF